MPVIISWVAFTAAFDFIIKTRSVEAGVIFSFAVLNIWYIYCLSFTIRQKLYKRKGKAYKGKIVKAEIMHGKGVPTCFLFIEFYKNHKKLIRRTGGYLGDPNKYLENNVCSIYEYNGRFIEADFNTRKASSENDVCEAHTEIEKHKIFMPKGSKYV